MKIKFGDDTGLMIGMGLILSMAGNISIGLMMTELDIHPNFFDLLSIEYGVFYGWLFMIIIGFSFGILLSLTRPKELQKKVSGEQNC